jgi:hypothetical protein
MTVVSWDRNGVMIVEFVQKGTTVTSELYCETLAKLRTAGHSEQRRGMLTYGVVLLHDSACPHTAARTRALLDDSNSALFDHHPYNPDLAPSDYHLAAYLKI